MSQRPDLRPDPRPSSGHVPFSVTYMSMLGTAPVATVGAPSNAGFRRTHKGAADGTGRRPGDTAGAPILRSGRGSSSYSTLPVKVGKGQPDKPRSDATVSPASKSGRPTSASHLRFHTASEWADAVTSDALPEKAPLSQAYAPRTDGDPVATPVAAEFRPRPRFDGTSVATKIISNAHLNSQLTSDWLAGSQSSLDGSEPAGDGRRRDEAKMAAPWVPPSPAAPGRPSTAGTSGRAGDGRRVEARVHSPRHQSYLDGIVVRLGKALPGPRSFVAGCVCQCV